MDPPQNIITTHKSMPYAGGCLPPSAVLQVHKKKRGISIIYKHRCLAVFFAFMCCFFFNCCLKTTKNEKNKPTLIKETHLN
jgi:hypothetical protein